VEWVRSAFVSSWFLYRDTDVQTRGRYVFAPASTPHYEGLHNLWSKSWVTEYLEDQPALGEVVAAKRVYDTGVPGAVAPVAGLVGTADCIRNGESYPSGQTDQLRGGWPLTCYDLNPPAANSPPPPVDLLDCHVQRLFAEISDLLYRGNGSLAVAPLQDALPLATITRVPNSSSPYPGSLVAVNGSETVVVVSGTTNAQQWALQAMFGASGQTDYGYYATLRLWNDAAGVILRRIDDAGADAAGPVRLVGHSYGGAVVALVAIRYRLGNPGRDIQVLTYGMPKPGDDRVSNLLSLVTQVHLVNSDDPVTFLPPSGPELAMVDWLVPLSVQVRWGVYQRPGGRVGLSPTGERTASPGPDPVYPFLFRLTTAFATNQPPEALTAHNAWEYHRRIVCPGIPAPSPPVGSPALWLRPDELAVAYPGCPFPHWPQAPFTTRPGDGETGFPVPTALTVNGNLGGRFLNGAAITVTVIGFPEVECPGDYSVWLIGEVIGGAGFNGPSIEGVTTPTVIDVFRDGLFWRFRCVPNGMLPQVYTFPFGTSLADATFIFNVVRTGSTVRMYVNGVLRLTFTDTALLPATFGRWTPFKVFTAEGAVWMPEVRVYDRTVGDVERGVIFAELRGRYPF